MLDRRTAARREWSVWWRYATVLVLSDLIVLVVCGILRNAPVLAGAAVMFLAFHTLFQLVVLGVATAILVRYHVRTFHVWAGAAIVNAPIVVASVLPYQYWFPSYLAATVMSVAWIVVVARFSFRLSDPRFAHLCRLCFYDLRGLGGPVCPECGTPITSPAAAPPSSPRVSSP
jgi:hypothetical protein